MVFLKLNVCWPAGAGGGTTCVGIAWVARGVGLGVGVGGDTSMLPANTSMPLTRALSLILMNLIVILPVASAVAEICLTIALLAPPDAARMSKLLRTG